MARLILIDSRVPDVSSIIETLTPETENIVFDYFRDSFATLQRYITKSYTSVAIVQHKYGLPTFQLVDAMSPAILEQLSEVDPEMNSWSEFLAFVRWLKTNGVENVDLLACDLWSDVNWRYAITKMEETIVTVRASIDITGADGNFVLESHNVDTIGLYFTPEILHYKHNFFSSVSPTNTNGYPNYTPFVLPATSAGVVSDSKYSAFLGSTANGQVPGGQWISNPLVADISNVVSVVMSGTVTNTAVAVLKSNGTVVTYGTYKYGSDTVINYGGDSSSVQSQLYNITKIVSTNNSFAALRSDGVVISWGLIATTTDTAGFLRYSDVSSTLTNVVNIYSSTESVFALTNTGKVIAFGQKSFGGQIPGNAITYLSSGVVKIATDRTNQLFIKNDGSAFVLMGTYGVFSNTSINTNPIVDGYVCNGSDFCIRSVANKTKQITNIAGSAFHYTMPEGVSVVKPPQTYSSGRIYMLLSNNVLLSYANSSGAPIVINNVTDFVINDGAFAYIQNGTVVVGGGANYGGSLTHAEWGLPAGTNLNNVCRLYSTQNSIGALKTDNTFVWWGYVSEPYASYYPSATFPTASAKTTQIHNLMSSNIASVYACPQGYLVTRYDSSMVILGPTGYQQGNATANFATKPADKHLYFYPHNTGFISVEYPITPDTSTASPGTQYSRNTVTYTTTNPDRMAIRGRKYALYSGSTLVSTWTCTEDSFTYTFLNAVMFQSGVASLEIYDAPDFIVTRRFITSFNVTVTPNPSVSEPDAPTITSVVIATKKLTINFTAPDWNGGTEIVGYKYSIDGGASYTTLPVTPAPIVLTNMNAPSYTIWLKTISWVGESYYTQSIAQMYTTPSAPTVVSSVIGNQQLTITAKTASNGGGDLSVFKYKLATDTNYTAVPLNPLLNALCYYRFDIGDLSGTSILNYASPTPTYDAKLMNGAQISTVTYARGTSSLYLNASPHHYLQLPPITLGSEGITIAFWHMAINGSLFFPGNGYDNKSNTGPIRLGGYNNPNGESNGENITLNDGTFTVVKGGVSYSHGLTSAGFTTPSSTLTTPYANASTWKHYTIVIHPQYWKFYVNGALAKTATTGIAYPNVEYPRYRSYLGTYYGPTDSFDRTLNGLMDEFAIFNRPFEDYEVSDIFNNSFNSTRFDIPNLLNGSTYTVNLRATNGAGDSATTTYGPITLGKVVPFAPVITSVVSGDTTAKIVFTPPYNGGEVITGYKYSINNSVSDSSYVSLGLVDGSFNITGLTNGTTYTVKMKATNSLCDSLDSAASVAFVPKTLPGAPTIQSATAGNQRATVVFSAPTVTGGSPITQYKYRLNGGSAVALPTLDASFVLTGLTNGTSYTLTMSAITIAGESVSSAASSAFVPSTTPAAPVITGVSIRNLGASVSFTVNNGGNALTDLQYSLNDASYVSVGTTSSPLVLNGLTNGEVYRVKLLVSNSIGSSPESVVSPNFIPMTVPDAPSITSIQPGNARLVVEFADASYNGSSPVTGYKYSINGGAYVSVGLVQSPYTIQNGIVNGTSYYVKIKSVNMMGDSLESVASESVVPFTAPSAPVIGAITNGDKQASIALSNGSNGGYPFVSYTYSINDGEPVVITSLSTLAFSDLVIGNEYNFKIKSATSVGESGYSTARFVGMSVPEKPVIDSIVARNNSAMVYFTAPVANQSAITGYTYSIGNGSVPVVLYDASSFLINGLTANNEYTVVMNATNAIGTSLVSDSDVVVPYTYPVAPTIDQIEVDNGSATIAYTAQSSNSSTITGFTYSLNNGAYQPVPEPFVLSDLSNGVAYTLRMKAVNAAGSSQTPFTAQFMPRTVPESPTISSVTAGNHSCEVEFKSGFFNGSVITKYRYSFNGTDFQDAVGTMSPITISGLTNGTTYMVYLLAVNGVGESNISAPSSAFVPFVTQSSPNPPTITSVVPGDNSVEITFEEGINTGSAIKGYLYSDNSGVAYKWAQQTESPLTITGLTNGTSYSFRLSAVNNSGPSEPSEPSSAVVPCASPSKPYITGVQGGNQSITVSFIPSESNGSEITGYMYSVNGGEYVAFSDETATISGLTNGTSYVVRIRAVNSVGMSEPSIPSASVVPFSVPDAPVINVVESLDEKIKVYFTAGNANGSSISYYEYALKQDGVLSAFANAPSLVSPFEIAGVVNGVSYSVVLRAVTSLGARSASSEESMSVVPCGVPSTPVIVDVIPSNSSLAVHYVSSANGSDITNVQYSLNSGVYMELSGNVSPFVVSDLVNGSVYSIKMKASNIAGTSDESNTHLNAVPFSVPDAPIINSVVPGDSKIQVAFTPGSANGSTLLGYKYSVNDLSYGWVDGTESPLTISGLTNGTSYVVKLKAVSEVVGESVASNASASVMPYRSPDAPIIQSVTPGNASATVVFLNGNLNGLVVSGYKYSLDQQTYTDVSANVFNDKLQMVIPGLVNGNTYSVSIKAVSIVGDSVASIVSASFTPFTNPAKPTIDKIITGNQTASIYVIDGALNGSGNVEAYQYTYDGLTYYWASSPVSPIVITSGLVNNQAYKIQVLTKTTKGVSPLSNQSSSFVPYTLPGAPTITGVVAGNGVAAISYTDGATNGRPLTKYQYSLNGGAYVDVAASSPIQLTGLTNGVSYAVALKCVNLAGASPASLLSSVFVPFTVPSAPTITNVVSAAAQVTVYVAPGNANGSAITKYSYSLNGGAYVSMSDAATSFTVTGLNNGTTYSIAVKAENAAGLSAASTSYTGVIPFSVPNAPTITSVTVGNGSATVNFTNGANNGRTITQYQYTYTSGTTSTTLTTSTSATQLTSFVITGLTNWTNYTVNVKAINLAGLSVASADSAQFMPFSIPGAPVIASVVSGNSSLTVNMDGLTIGAGVIGYRYSFDGTNYTYKSGGGSSFVITGLENAQSYVVRVKSVTSLGDSVPSVAYSPVVPFSVPNFPTVTSVIPGNKNATIYVVDGSNNGSPISGYEYSFDGVNYTIVDPVSPIVVSNLLNWTPYSFYVKAVNQAGRSQPGPPSTAVVPYLIPTSASIASIVPGDSHLRVNMNGYTDDSGIIGYKYSFDASGYSYVASPSDSFVIPSLENGQTYRFYVKSTTTAGDSPASTQSLPEYPRAPPSPPLNVVVTPLNESASVMFLDNSANGAPIEYYKYSINGDIDVPIKKREDGTIRIFGISNAVEYTLRLRAVNNAGPSQYSQVSNAFVPYGSPRTPVITKIMPGNNSAFVHFSPIDTNGSPLTNFKYSLGGSLIDVSGLTSPLTIPNLVNKTSYNISIVACNAGGNSNNSNGLPITVGVPDAPVITNVVVNSKRLLVYFDIPSDNGNPITGYMFGFEGSPTLAKAIYLNSTSVSPIQIVNLKNGTAYNPFICAVNKNGNSVPSNMLGNKIPCDVPAKIVVSSVTPAMNSALVFFSTPPDNGAPILKYKYALNANTDFIDASGLTLPMRIPDVPVNTAFTVKVIATNSAGDSLVSLPSKPATYVYLPPAVVKVTALTMPTRNSLSVAFVAPALNGAPIIKYQYALNADTTFTDASGTTLPLLITEGIVPNVNYNVRIIAVNSAGSSAPSAPLAKPVTTVYLPPLAPAVASIIPGNASALVTFTAPALRGAPITGYAYSIDASGLVLQDISGALTSPITITGLTNDTLYNIRIAAITPVGYSALSAAKPVTPVFKAPGVPVVGTIVAGNGQLTVNFTAPVENGSPILGYKYTLNGGVKIPAVLATGGKSFVITKNVVDEVDVPLVNGTAYQVQVCATNSIGDSVLSVAKPGTPKA